MSDDARQTDPADAALALRADILQAALPHVPFEGWSEATLRAAATATGHPLPLVRALYPRGGVDLALAFHAWGDAEMTRRLAAEDLAALRLRDRIARAVWLRLEVVPDRELVRRGATLFALPHYAADGVRALWATADAIWTALGVTATGFDHYSRRATLSGVHAATVLFWLGDDSPGQQATRAFLDRRIEDVMQVEKLKARIRGLLPASGPLAARPPAGDRGDRPRPQDMGAHPGRLWT